jgi:hypothetical protein
MPSAAQGEKGAPMDLDLPAESERVVDDPVRLFLWSWTVRLVERSWQGHPRGHAREGIVRCRKAAVSKSRKTRAVLLARKRTTTRTMGISSGFYRMLIWTSMFLEGGEERSLRQGGRSGGSQTEPA